MLRVGGVGGGRGGGALRVAFPSIEGRGGGRGGRGGLPGEFPDTFDADANNSAASARTIAGAA